MHSADQQTADLAAPHQREIDRDQQRQFQVRQELEEARDVDLEQDRGQRDCRPRTHGAISRESAPARCIR